MSKFKKIIFLILSIFLFASSVYADTAKQVDFLLSGYRHPTTDEVLSGGKVWTFLDGTSTMEPLYTDKDQGGTATNPIILDDSGKAEVFGAEIYKFVIYDSEDNIIETLNGLEYIPSSTVGEISEEISNISDLRAITETPQDNQKITVLGYYSEGDGGDGQFFWDSTNTDSDDGFFTFKLSSITTGRLKRLESSGVIAVEKIGIISNDDSESTRTTNTEMLIDWISPVIDGGNNDDIPISLLFSKNQTYYFNGIITIKSNVILDLGGGVLQFDYTTASGDESSACLYGTRLFTIKNGSIVANFLDPSSIANSTNVIKGGNRGDSGSYFQDYWDSLLTESQGDFTIKDINITITATGTGVPNGIQIIGGTRNTVVENIVIESDNPYMVGVYYEFGWATDESTASDRETSHGYNMYFKNITVNSTDLTASVDTCALGLRGAYNAHVDGLYASEVGTIFDGSPGEAAFYNPWDPRDVVGAKANILLENITGTANKVGLSLIGSVTGGYLVNAGVLTGDDQYALADYTVNNFAVTGTSISSWGVQDTGRNVKLTNGVIKSFLRGIFASQPGPNSKLMLDNVNILSNRESGIETATTTGSYTLGMDVRNCHIAGNGRDGTDTDMNGIKLTDVDGVLIENNQFGYNVENNQLHSVNVSTDSTNVTVRHNRTLDLKHTGVAYTYYTNSFSIINGIVLDKNFGVTTSNGWWERKGEFSRTTPEEGTYVKSNIVWSAAPAITAPIGWMVVTSKNTNLNGGEPSGETSIVVDSGTSTANGDVIGVMLDDGTIHWSTISSGGGTTTLVIADALTDDAADENLVFVYLFADMPVL